MWSLAILALSAILLVTCVYVATFGNTLSDQHELWGQFGDYVGGVLGPILALLALVALLITLHIQSREMEISSRQLRHSAKALSEQSRSLQLQNFERRFFDMLSLHHELINGMDLYSKKWGTTQGRDCLVVFFDRLKSNLESSTNGDNRPHIEKLLAGYEVFYKKHNQELSHYFRHVYRTLKIIDECDIAEKKDYAGILRAQLSNAELGLLFYNGLTSHGTKLKPLAEKYALFENMELTILQHATDDLGLYNVKAFGDQTDLIQKGHLTKRT